MSGILTSLAKDALQEGVFNMVTDPRVGAKILRSASRASGVAAAQAEYAARSLRRQEIALGERARLLEQSVTSKPDQSLVSLIQDCWKE